METAEPFRNFSPKEFLKNRFSPLVVTFVDPDADKIIKNAGFSFVDLTAAIGAQLPNPIRIVPAERVMTWRQEDFLAKVVQDTTAYGKCFTEKEFEDKDEVKLEFSPDYGVLKNKIYFPSFESAFPPWYKRMLFNLCASIRYSEFEFYDLPQTILYVISPGLAAMSAEELRRLISFPEWMKEFLTTIPIVKVVVYDTLISREIPKELTSGRGSFEEVIGFPFRTRTNKSPDGPDMITARNLFRYDGHILNDPRFCNNLTDTDFANAKSAVQKIYENVERYIKRTISARMFEIEENNKFSNSVKNFFKSKNAAPERVTRVLQIPWKKIIYSQLAALFFITGKYADAQKNYDLFIKNLDNLPVLRANAHFMIALSHLVLPLQGTQHFKRDISELLHYIGSTNNLRLILYFPLICTEIHAALGEEELALTLIKKSYDIIRKLWQGTSPNKILVLALIHERYAGLTRNDHKSWSLTSNALALYKQCNQFGHALRCAIWLMKVLPKESWPLMYQTVWLDKTVSLFNLGQGARSLGECKELLSLRNLQPWLHEKTISQFFAPYNDPSMSKSILNIHINPLVEVKKLRMIDPSTPEFFGFDTTTFDDLEKDVDDWHMVRIDRSYTKSIDNWDMAVPTKSKKMIGIGQQVYFVITLYNRYKFTVHLDHSVLVPEYQGDATENIFDIDEVNNKDIRAYNSSDIKYGFTPHAEGSFKIAKFSKNYWGYVETEIECGPITFNVIHDYPTVNLTIEDLPENVIAWQCIKFNACVENKGKTLIKYFSIAFDHPHSITYEGGTDQIGESSVITINQEIEPGQTCRVPLIFRATKLNLNEFHFIVSIMNHKCAFALAKVNVSPAAKIEATAFKRQNDSGGHAIQMTITPLIDGFKLYGFMSKNGKLVKTLAINKEQLKANVPESVVCFPADELDEEVEKWRVEMMGNSPLAVLFKIGETENCLLAQKNINFNYIKKPFRFILDCHSHMERKKGEIMKVFVRAENLENEVMISPLPIVYVCRDRVGPTPCRFVGVTKVVLSKENNYSAEFSCVAFKSGIYRIPGISFSGINNHDSGTVTIQQDFRVTII
ncbi:hypothetical protein TVAG_189790 [Trichomonas vaginalis G3]|uniref:Uncharacterized protein n=1 Tax=Trichomonas vaginalis (strain ATCC PRA-98 / G3) TaxID=412133 RepID=A2DKB1_TRIV3|nr:transport protein TRAPP family [Trichomonas vaginalis G3]EAY19088.1 hypothetical protein TVAG_189790 [Trichomonas vaginalis G3]KAI5490387.1 transport protein TRAPP family [Trichomonas vaginalis G3]|eukprot:XP_001580074.1 hypothetical protein [Trichomonas vaginalis G3]